MTMRISRRLAAFAGAGALTAVAVLGASPAFASQPVDGSHKVAYCHATHSATNPFVYIETDTVAVIRAHEKHQDDEDAIPSFDYVWDGVPGTFPGQGDTSMIGAGSCEGGGIG